MDMMKEQSKQKHYLENVRKCIHKNKQGENKTHE